jgi:hypothetical protein
MLAAAITAAPAAAQQVRGVEGAVAHFNQSQDSSGDRIVLPSPSDRSGTFSSRTTASRALRIAVANHNASADTQQDRITIRESSRSNYSTRGDGLSPAQRIAIENHNASADRQGDRIWLRN